MCAEITTNPVKKQRNIMGLILLIASVAVFLNILRYTAGFDIWYDEVFSLSFVKYSYKDIIGLTARDVHPPLYYFYLKAVCDFAREIFGQDSIYMAAKLASCLPWIVLFILSVTYIRKRFSLFSAGLFLFLVTLMPQIAIYYVEIRMYSFALMLVTAHILVADRILENKDKTSVSIALWTIYFLLGILTAYTQYYACIATVGIYIGTGVSALIGDKEKRKWNVTGTVICALLSVAAYLPWLSVLSEQMEHISGIYWIQPLTLRSIAGCVKYITLPVTYAWHLPVISAALLLITLIIYFVLWIIRSVKTGDTGIIRFFLLMVLPLVVVIISGFILSALGTPIFVYRYMIPALGGFWLFFAIAAGRLTDTDSNGVTRAICFMMVLSFVLDGGLCFKGFCDEESKKLAEQVNAETRVDSIPTGSVIITNFDHVTSVLGYYRPDCEVCLYEEGIDTLLPDMLESIRYNTSDEAIGHYLDSGKNVYFYGSFNSREDIVNAWEEQGIEAALLDSILIERYWINVYELHKN